MDGQCATCRWWDRREDVSTVNMGVCRLFSEGRQFDWPDRRAMAMTPDMMQYATFCTARDFSCVQHEPS